MNKVVIFDFDKTLTYQDTLSGFYFEISREKSFRIIRHLIYFLFEAGYALKLISNDALKRAGVKLFLNGIPFDRYQSCCVKYGTKIQLNPTVLRLLRKREKEGYEIWILSASFEDYIKSALNVNVQGSKLQVDGGRVIGLESNNFGRIKRSFVLSHFKDRSVKEFYTDHVSDFEAASLAESVFMVRGNSIEEIKLK